MSSPSQATTSNPATDAEGLGVRTTDRSGCIDVKRVPRRPKAGVSYWIQSPNGTADLTHRLFRFPAKFHVPIVQWALGTFGRRGSKVLDPFTGSGTVQLEALRRGIASYGVDVDPLSVFVARAKTTPLPPRALRTVQQHLQDELLRLRLQRGDVQDTPGADIAQDVYEAEVHGLDVPCIPNIQHWLRRYVIVDLALIKARIEVLPVSRKVSDFLFACFAATIRKVSNADPAPVSGLEVTSVQERRNVRRKISVVDAFLAKLDRETRHQMMLWEELARSGRSTSVRVLQGDALDLSTVAENAGSDFPLVVTSPPYCRSVEYSRRHRLELFWLDHVESADDHVQLSHRYLGRNYVRVGDWTSDVALGLDQLDEVIQTVEKRNVHRARAIHHYFYHMSRALREVRTVMRPSGTLVVVVGNSTCSGVPVRTADYLAELAGESFRLDYRFSYAIRNHYMQYGLWNGTGIRKEHVLVFKAR